MPVPKAELRRAGADALQNAARAREGALWSEIEAALGPDWAGAADSLADSYAGLPSVHGRLRLDTAAQPHRATGPTWRDPGPARQRSSAEAAFDLLLAVIPERAAVVRFLLGVAAERTAARAKAAEWLSTEEPGPLLRALHRYLTGSPNAEAALREADAACPGTEQAVLERLEAGRPPVEAYLGEALPSYLERYLRS